MSEEIPSAEEYLDYSGFPLMPGYLYLDVNSNDYVSPLSRPSKIFPFWNCNTFNPSGFKGRQYDTESSRGLRLINPSQSKKLLERMLKQIETFPIPRPGELSKRLGRSQSL